MTVWCNLTTFFYPEYFFFKSFILNPAGKHLHTLQKGMLCTFGTTLRLHCRKDKYNNIRKALENAIWSHLHGSSPQFVYEDKMFLSGKFAENRMIRWGFITWMVLTMCRFESGLFIIIRIPTFFFVPVLKSHFCGTERCHSVIRQWYWRWHTTLSCDYLRSSLV